MKKLLALMALLVTLSLTGTAWPNSASTTINISIRVDKFAEWADASPVIVETDWSGPINKINQSRLVSKTITLYTNTDTIITAKAGLNNGILTNGSDTLQTAYKITGSVSNPDGIFKDPAAFFNTQNSYTVVHEKETGNYAINLQVQATSPANAAPEEGLYTCGVILTAAW